MMEWTVGEAVCFLFFIVVISLYVARSPTYLELQEVFVVGRKNQDLPSPLLPLQSHVDTMFSIGSLHRLLQ